MRSCRVRAAALMVVVLTFAGAYASADGQAGVREVSFPQRGVTPLQTRLRYTTMVVLPDGEEILDVICGDKDYWVISATHNIAHVKPAKAGAETNLNLVTSSGTVYSFTLAERSSPPDLKVYIAGPPDAPIVKPRYFSAAQVEALESQLAEARATIRDGDRKAEESVAAYRQQYPARLQFAYGPATYQKPFLVRAMWHDGQFTYIKSDANELPALYELQDGKPALVNFQVRENTYVVPKVLERGYLVLGTRRFPFEQQGAMMMAEHTGAPDTAPVSDRRQVPRGVLPRGFQTWLMAGLAVGIVLIIVVAGKREPTAGPAPAAAAPSAPNPDRLRDYQDRLRAMDARRAQETQAAAPPAPVEPRSEAPGAPAPEDPLKTDRKRREYESLFASNVVLSRRPEPERPDAGRPAAAGSAVSTPREAGTPSLDDIAQAVMRATGRSDGAAPNVAGSVTTTQPAVSVSPAQAPGRDQTKRPERTEPISSAGPLHPLLEGTVIDAVLTNRLDGSGASPVNCLVTNPVYSHDGQHVLIPAGARILGETRAVQALGETRLAVAFHRLVMPDGRTQRLDQFLGLNQIGDAGLRDKVNQHYWSTFGAAGAVGLISGLAQLLGTAGVAGGTGDRTVIVGSGADAASQASLQVMSRFLNRLPTITIREGHRVKVYLTGDLELPAYAETSVSNRS